MQHPASHRRENRLDMRVSQSPATLGNTLFLPYKEGVAGSNPASPTFKFPANSGLLWHKERARASLSCASFSKRWFMFRYEASPQIWLAKVSEGQRDRTGDPGRGQHRGKRDAAPRERAGRVGLACGDLRDLCPHPRGRLSCGSMTAYSPRGSPSVSSRLSALLAGDRRPSCV